MVQTLKCEQAQRRGLGRLSLWADELVALQGRRDIVGRRPVVRLVSAEHLPYAAQPDALVRWYAEGDDVFDGRPDFRFPLGCEQYATRTDILRQTGLRYAFCALACNRNAQLKVEPSGSSLFHSI